MNQENQERAKQILFFIKERNDNGEKPMPCIFNITTPKLTGMYQLKNDENIKMITNILDKYNIYWQTVDTVPGSYNLNRDWIETKDIPCYIEYDGVYPTEWDIEDVVTLEKMDREGKIIIQVTWHPEKDKYISNN